MALRHLTFQLTAMCALTGSKDEVPDLVAVDAAGGASGLLLGFNVTAWYMRMGQNGVHPQMAIR